VSTAHLFVETVDAIRSLGWALAVWVVLLAAVASLALWTVLVTVAWACRAVWRGVAAALALVQRSQAPEPLPEPHKPAQTRVARSRPSWAQPDEEAA